MNGANQPRIRSAAAWSDITTGYVELHITGWRAAWGGARSNPGTADKADPTGPRIATGRPEPYLCWICRTVRLKVFVSGCESNNSLNFARRSQRQSDRRGGDFAPSPAPARIARGCALHRRRLRERAFFARGPQARRARAFVRFRSVFGSLHHAAAGPAFCRRSRMDGRARLILDDDYVDSLGTADVVYSWVCSITPAPCTTRCAPRRGWLLRTASLRSRSTTAR